MSFFKSIGRAFGFGGDYDEDEVIESEYDETSAAESVAEEKQEPVEGLSELPSVPAISDEVKSRIFDGVVAIFNEALPDFLQKSVDPALQSRRIVESLDSSLNEYLDNVVFDAQRYAEGVLKHAAEEAKKEAERLRNEMEKLDQQRVSLREQQLSADRRRRALADRMTDLEAQLAAADAEREQFDLEKKSLLNKIKLADIQPGVVEEMAREIESLKAARAAEVPNPEDIEKLKEEVANLQRDLQQHKEQVELGQTMYNDLQNQLVAEREGRVKAEAEVADAKKIYDSVVEMQEQMGMVEGLIRKRDERIAKLKASNKKLKDEISEIREELARNRVLADGGLFDLVDSEEEVKPTDEDEAAIAAIEEDFECPDWFVSEPAPGEPGLRAASEEPFGYTAPVRKPAPDNDAQLSLFD